MARSKKEEDKKKRQKVSKASKSLKISSSTPFKQQWDAKKKAIKKTHPGKEGDDIIKKLYGDYKSMGYI